MGVGGDTDGRCLQRLVSDGGGSSLQSPVALGQATGQSRGQATGLGGSASTLLGGPSLTSGTWTT